MTAYFEQWLNGLVYELFFPAELHARQLRLFEATARLNPPALKKLSDAQKLTRLQELYEQASTPNAPHRGPHKNHRWQGMSVTGKFLRYTAPDPGHPAFGLTFIPVLSPQNEIGRAHV